MRVVFLENDDSFSWNVIDGLPFSRDELSVLAGRQAARNLGCLAGADALVIGPGPGYPVRAGLVEVVLAAARLGLPTLGICLGHQAIGLAFGASLVRTPPMHGKISRVVFGASRYFDKFEVVMRYHSLALAEVAGPLRVTSWTPEGIPMSIEHESLPIAGLQFHPDSFATAGGLEILASFFRRIP